MTAVSPRQQLTKPIAGGVFVLFWIIAIVLWVFAGVALGNAGAWQPFIVDVGIIFASIGIAALSLATKKGLGLAFLFTPLFSTSLGSIPPKLYSYGSATVATLQQVAGAAGIAIFVALYATGLAAAGNLDPEHPSAAEAANGSHLAFLAGGIISLAVILVSIFITRPPVQEGHGEWAPAEAEVEPA